MILLIFSAVKNVTKIIPMLNLDKASHMILLVKWEGSKDNFIFMFSNFFHTHNILKLFVIQNDP